MRRAANNPAVSGKILLDATDKAFYLPTSCNFQAIAIPCRFESSTCARERCAGEFGLDGRN
jgi:hypothetical protein